MLKKIVKLFIVSLLFPFIFFYNKYLRFIVDEINGKCCSIVIKNKGLNLKIHGYIKVYDSDNLLIGDYCRIGKGAFFFAKGKIIIGNNVQISRNVTIYSANHNFKSDIFYPYDNTYICKSVLIEDSVWIGMNVNILPGVKIGKGAIIGMGSTISKDIEPYSIVVGQNQVVGKRKLTLNIDDKETYFGRKFPNS